MRLTESERTTMVNALRVAADVYTQDAERVGNPKTIKTAWDVRVSNLHAQFTLQAFNARSLADSIENAETIEYTPGE